MNAEGIHSELLLIGKVVEIDRVAYRVTRHSACSCDQCTDWWAIEPLGARLRVLHPQLADSKKMTILSPEEVAFHTLAT